MNADQMAVLGPLHVKFKPDAKLQARAKIGERVLRGMPQQTPMSHDSRQRPISGEHVWLSDQPTNHEHQTF
jgi:hypothetical protein